MKKKSIYVAVLVVGVCLIAASFLVGDSRTIAGLCMGIGFGISGLSIAHLVMKRMEEKNPALMEQNRIEQKDERNVLIVSKAKARAADIFQWFVVGIGFATIAADCPLWLTLATVAVFLLYNILWICFMARLQKEM